MHSFKDTKNRAWTFDFNLGIVERIEAELDIDISTGETGEAGEFLQKLGSGGVRLLGQLLWILCEDQARDRNVDEKSFIYSLGGDVLDDATDALIEAYIDFFPRLKRGPMRTIVEKYRHAQQQAAETANELANDGRIDRAINELLAEQKRELEESLEELSGKTSGEPSAV